MTTDMVFTTILFVVVARTLWRWSIPLLMLIGAGFLTVDLGFWGANIVKAPDGEPAHFELEYGFTPAGNDWRGPMYRVTWHLRLGADPDGFPERLGRLRDRHLRV